MKSYPNHVIVNRERYNINTDYRVALRCFDVINSAKISDLERTLAIIYLLYGTIPKDAETQRELLVKAGKYLRCGVDEETQESRPRDMDFNQDAGYIYASFMSDYHIDIDDIENLHWWKYIELIQGLTEKSVLSRVREIRNYDLSEIKDAKYRSQMAQAKKSVALKEELTEEEKEKIKAFEDLFRG